MRWLTTLVAVCVALGACTSTSDQSITTTTVVATTVAPATSTTAAPATSTTVATAPAMHPGAFTTFPGHDGTRFAAGTGSLPTATPVDIALPEPPVWVVGIPLAEGPIWSVALESGAIVGVHGDGSIERLGSIPPGAPPAFALVEDRVALVHPPQEWGSPRSHPIVLEDGTRVIVDGDGAIRVGAESFDVAAPPDARLLRDDSTVLVVSGATTRYPHGALGDAIEGSAVTAIDTAAREATTLIELPDPAVFEGTTPMWADLDGDGVREILLTVSHPADGARLVLYDAFGEVAAEGPAIGRRNRWRHQVAAAPFGPGGETEIAAVRTPHIGGTVEFYRWAGDALEVVATVGGFSSHRFLSPNLDIALAADADGDGRVELVVPTDNYTELGGIRRTDDGAEVAWRVPIGDRMVTNLGVVARPDGTLGFAVGTAAGFLRIWS